MKWKTFDEFPPKNINVLVACKTGFDIAKLIKIDDVKGLYFEFFDGGEYFLKNTFFTHWCEVELPKK